jgi:ERCC4-type nuclease
MTIDIKIDTREPSLQALLKAYHKDAKPEEQSKITLQIEPLDIGDVQIVCNQHSILFERKSCGDLASSIKDGRYRNQKMRLLANGTPPRHIIYILEGVPTQQSMLSSNYPVHGLKPSVLSGMIIYTMLRDGIHVVQVQNTTESAAWIWTIAMKCCNSPEKVFGNIIPEQQNEILYDGEEKGENDVTSNSNNYLQTIKIKVKKMDNVTPNNCYLMQLCQIPGVSITTATEISKKYKSMFALLQALSKITEPENRIKLLTELPMIGKKKAQVILSYLLTDVTEVTEDAEKTA